MYATITDQDLRKDMYNYNPDTITKCSHNVDESKLVGMMFGKYKILEYMGRNKDGRIIVSAICTKCGWVDNYRLTDLRQRAFDLGEICSHKSKWSDDDIDPLGPKTQSLIGRTIGKYYIKERLEDDKHGHGVYLVHCNDCNWEGPMVLSAILSSSNNDVKKCHHYVDYDEFYSGKTIGKYKILNLEFTDQYGKPFFKCICNVCGRETVVNLGSIRNSINNTNERCTHNRDNENLVGETIGKYTILSYEGQDETGNHIFKVRCNKCGWEGINSYGELVKMANDSMNLYCSHRIDWKVPEIGYAYTGMIDRCYGRILPAYEGITVCDEWLGYQGKLNFRDWALANGFEPGLTLDRIDSTKGYYPENCQWVSLSYNTKFTSTTNVIHIRDANGFDICDSLQGWTARLGLYQQYFNYYFPISNYNSNEDRLNDITNFIINKLNGLNDCNDNLINVCFMVDNDRPIGYDFNKDGELVKKQ